MKQRKVMVLFGCFLMTLSGTGCIGGLKQNRIAVSYTEQIQKLPGGSDAFWPDKKLRNAFFAYWNLRYSDEWRNAYEKEAPYFQEIISRAHYENILKGAVKNPVVGIEILSIQKITSQFYEIKIMLQIETSTKGKKTSYFTDRWVYAGENWYHVMRDGILFPKAS